MADTRLNPLTEDQSFVRKDDRYYVYNEVENQKLLTKQVQLEISKGLISHTHSFINSFIGHLVFNNKLEIENSMKSFCMESCITESSLSTNSLTQKEKNCLTNCTIEANQMYEGFKKYQIAQYTDAKNKNYFNMPNSIPVDRL